MIKPHGTAVIVATFLSKKLLLPVSSQTCPDLIWSDEFDGTALNQNHWEVMLGNGCDYGICGWGNNELQSYEEENIIVSGDGKFRIEARQGGRGKRATYTSARIRTLTDFTHGLFEARIKIPIGQGIWPAFWMLPSKPGGFIWPDDGEIDIMENVGHTPSTTCGTIHFADDNGNHMFSGSEITLPNEEILHDNFHDFAVEKQQDSIRWLLDGYVFFERTRSDVMNWPFDDNPFHFLLNVAVGGNWPGNPDGTTQFPQQMVVDYLRVYNGNPGMLNGPRSVDNMEQNVQFSLDNGIDDYTYVWTVPSDAMIVSGQNSNTIMVDFGEASGRVSVDVSSTECDILKQFSVGVYVHPAYSFSYRILENEGNNQDQAAFDFATGDYSVVDNPVQVLNPTAKVARYVRATDEQYDVLIFSTSAITNLNAYITGHRTFFIDLLTSTSQEVLLQLEDSTKSQREYPSGRHSRFVLHTEGTNVWERHRFEFLDQPDPSITSIDQITLLFAPNTYTGDTYYLDNLDSYVAEINCTPTFGYEVCDDGTDNDCDGNVDCADPDCFADPACSCAGEGESCSALPCCAPFSCRGNKCR